MGDGAAGSLRRHQTGRHLGFYQELEIREDYSIFCA